MLIGIKTYEEQGICHGNEVFFVMKMVGDGILMLAGGRWLLFACLKNMLWRVMNSNKRV